MKKCTLSILEEFTSVLDQLWAVFYYLPILTTTKWTMDLGQQQNGTKLAYISNGVDKQQKLPKRGPKNTCMVPQKIISMKQLKILEKSDHRVFFSCCNLWNDQLFPLFPIFSNC